MKKIVIVGANSYIARNLILTLKNSKERFEIKLYDYALEQIDGFENYTQIDINSSDSVKKIDFNCDIIYMFVGKTGSEKGFTEYNTFLDINERSLLALLNEYTNQQSKAKIIFPSTRLVYKGKQGRLSEDSEKEFKTIYAINKYACEKYLEMFHNAFGVNYCIFRICIPYGTLIPNATSYGTAEFMLTKAIKGENIVLYGEGSVRRTLIYIGDLCNILVEGALSDKCINDVYNIGGEDYSLKEMAIAIADKYKVGIDYKPWPSISKLIESGNTVFEDKKLKDILKYKITEFKSWIDDIPEQY
ncbi:NAD-dependent epimerase/dehydratase family protein [Paraclostridium bifermentans]|uniref:NAD-dependent epimerase/dehydratase family protein n=1 Tax=Paraclostridium bifermentans TaxID=1490 RepID=UPI00189D8C38|nr:NAD(P)-dependent oxidoreductase [Paraclostridium bifermentans]